MCACAVCVCVCVCVRVRERACVCVPIHTHARSRATPQREGVKEGLGGGRKRGVTVKEREVGGAREEGKKEGDRSSGVFGGH